MPGCRLPAVDWVSVDAATLSRTSLSPPKPCSIAWGRHFRLDVPASWGTTLIANWTFVLWEGYRGVLLHLTRLYGARIERWRKELRVGLVLRSVVAAGKLG